MDKEKEISVKWSNMVNRILSIIEMALPEDSKQYKSVKKNLNLSIYDARNAVLDGLNMIDPTSERKFINKIFKNMNNNICNILLITIEEKERREAMVNAIDNIIQEVNSDVMYIAIGE